MSTPKLQIYNDSSSNIQDSWNAGTLNLADSATYESDVLVIQVWNNRYGNTDVPDLVGCNITTKDVNGDNDNEQVVTEKWVQAKVESESSIFSAIGGTTVCMINAQNGLTDAEKEEYTLKGTANGGSSDIALTNYSRIYLKAVPTINAKTGVHYFKTRISGYYV